MYVIKHIYIYIFFFDQTKDQTKLLSHHDWT